MAVEIAMPRLSDAMEEGTIIEWLVAEGDEVRAGDPLVEVETDKATVVYAAEDAGTILRLHAGTGASVVVGAVIATIGAAGEHIAAPATAVAAAEPPPVVPRTPPSPDAVDARVSASPLARRIAATLGVHLAALAGSGPQGRVIRADVERHAQIGGSAQARGGQGAVTRSTLSGLQKTIARRMVESRATVPDFELRREIDMSAVAALRQQLREQAESVPSYNDFTVKAAALALREHPRVNGAYVDKGFEAYSRVNVGIAVAADDGLLVPTIFDADRLTLEQIGRLARELAAKVRDGSISPAELSGGTFSITNLGMFGVDGFSAVINAPQAAILAVGSVKPRPMVADDGVTLIARPTLDVSLACDHRILYGADGARFLQRFTELLERPLALLM